MAQFTDKSADIEAVFCERIASLRNEHLPSRHPFFAELANCPTERLLSPGILDELYRRYQAAMHASRSMGYFLPHLDVVSLRVRKLHILAEDDGIEGGDTHHYQLRRTWTTLLGRPPVYEDHEFGDLDSLKIAVDSSTASFISLVQEHYPRSLGPWVMVEGLAHNWIGALLNGLTPHFPRVGETAYFTENYFNGIELNHAKEAMEMTLLVLDRRPALLEETLAGAERMAEGLDALWSGLQAILSPIG